MAGNDNNTVLLLPFQGADGENIVVDTSVGGTPGKVFANTAEISTDQKKFDESSLFCRGGGQSLKVDPHIDFAFGNLPFTVDCQIRTDVVSQSYGWAWYQDADNYFGLVFQQTDGPNDYRFGVKYRFQGVDIFSVLGEILATSQFNHVAIIRDGGDIGLYSNGSRHALTSISTTLGINAYQWPLYIGQGVHEASHELRPHSGYIDQFRITLAAEWSGLTYQPPTHSYFAGASSDCVGAANVLAPSTLDAVGRSGVDLVRTSLENLGGSDVQLQITEDYLGTSTLHHIATDAVGGSTVTGPLETDNPGGSTVLGPLVADCIGHADVIQPTHTSDCIGSSDTDRQITGDNVGASNVSDNFSPDLTGISTLETSTDEYRLYHKLDAEVGDAEFAAAPFATSATLPMVVAMSGVGLHFLVLRRANKYGLETQNREQSVIELDATSDLLILAPSSPVFLTLDDVDSGDVLVRAKYFYEQDQGRGEATHFRLWVTTDGSTPDPDAGPPLL